MEEPSSDNAIQPTVEEIEALWEARLEQTREEAHAEGFAAGRYAAASEFKHELDEANERFGVDLANLQQACTTFMRDAEPQMVQLAFRIARTILDSPLPDDVRQISERAIAEAVEKMSDEVPIEILLHPVSYLRIQESGIEEHLSAIHNKLRWRTNPDLKQNEWIVQSARAATRRLEAELIDRLQRDLSMRDIHREEDGQ
jgi:flagellar biosynthesis/type III secretory pathway protein FliH